MRITLDTAEKLELHGRRTDGEEGEEGLWLLWLVGVAFVGAGAAILAIEDGWGDRIMGTCVLALGVLLLGFGLYRFARREHLILDLPERRGRYGKRTWPSAAGYDFSFAFGDVRKIRIRRRIERPGHAKKGPSLEYVTWDACLLVKPRKTISLERTKHEDRVRELAQKVAALIGVEVEE
jgi:hypothetical protein